MCCGPGQAGETVFARGWARVLRRQPILNAHGYRVEQLHPLEGPVDTGETVAYNHPAPVDVVDARSARPVRALSEYAQDDVRATIERSEELLDGRYLGHRSIPNHPLEVHRWRNPTGSEQLSQLSIERRCWVR